MGAIDSFNGFLHELSVDLNLECYNSIVIQCFSKFIIAAQYRN